MLLCLISWIIITNIGCTSKISSLPHSEGSNAAYASEWKYFNDLMALGRKRRESYVSCSQSPIQNNMTLKGGIQAGYFRKLAEHVAMQLCVELCCEDKGCDVAFMTGKSCYGVQCYNEELCLAFPAKRKVNDPVLISHVTFKGEKVVPKDQARGKLQCVSTRIKVGATLRGGLKAGNFTDVGIVEDAKVCVNLCCVSETCNVAMMVNERCFLVSCFSTKLCQMTRSLTPLYQSSLAYIQRKPLIGKREKGNTSLSYDDNDNQLVCKNSKIFYNSTLKGGYHAGNYTNFGIVPNISSCIRWCCGNRDCDAAFMLENNCFAVACKTPDDCLPVHAKSSSSSAALKPRISYITSRSEEVKIKEDVSSGGVCHAGIVSYDVTLRGGSNAGKFTPHGVVKNMKTCIFKCCQSEGCNVAMMLKDLCFSIACDSDEKCEKKPTQISSHFNPRIAYVFRDKLAKSKKTGSTKEMIAQAHHHETLKHKKKMMLIEQLHALTNPNVKYPTYNSYQSNNISMQAMSGYPTFPTKKLLNVYKTPISKITTNNDLNATIPFSSKYYAKKYYRIKKNATEVKFIPNLNSMNNETYDTKFRPLSPPLYNFLKGNFDLSSDKHSMLPSLPKGFFNNLRYDKEAKLYQYKLNQYYNKRMMNSTILQNPSSFSMKPYTISNSTTEKINLLNNGVTTNYQAENNSINLTLSDKGNEHSVDTLIENSANTTKTENTTSIDKELSEKEEQKYDENDDFDEESSSFMPDANNQTRNVNITAKEVENIISTEDVNINNKNSKADQNNNDFSSSYKRQDIPVEKTTNDSVIQVANSSTTYSNDFKDVKNGFVTPMYNATLVSNTNLDVNEEDKYKTNVKIGNSDPTCFRSKVFHNVTLRGGYGSGKFKDRGKMKDVIECATLCCHLNKCDLVMMLLNRCFSVDCKSSKLCEAVPAKSPVFSPTIVYVSHL